MIDSVIYQKVADLFPENSVDAEWLRENCEKLCTPPRTSVLRVNTLLANTADASSDLSRILGEQNSEFSVRRNSILDYVLEVDAIGPCDWSPCDRRVIIFPPCAKSVLRGAHIYASGVVAIEEAIDDDPMSVSVWVDLDSKCTRGLKRRYDGNVVCIGNGQLLVERDVLFHHESTVKGAAICMTEMTWMMPSFENLPSAVFYPQNFPSILAVDALDLEPNMKVLDMCAAPGGKTLHIAALMKNQGQTIAIDKSKAKVDKLKMMLPEMGAVNVLALHADSSKLLFDDAVVSYHADGRALFAPNSFDKILLDPPCSGIGQRPLININDQTFSNSGFAEYQRKLLTVASRLLKVGGVLVYSTCTLAFDENEGNILHAIQNLPLRLCAADSRYSSPDVRPVSCADGDLDDRAVYRFWPSSKHDSIAFFFAKFVKI